MDLLLYSPLVIWFSCYIALLLSGPPVIWFFCYMVFLPYDPSTTWFSHCFAFLLDRSPIIYFSPYILTNHRTNYNKNIPQKFNTLLSHSTCVHHAFHASTIESIRCSSSLPKFATHIRIHIYLSHFFTYPSLQTRCACIRARSSLKSIHTMYLNFTVHSTYTHMNAQLQTTRSFHPG